MTQHAQNKTNNIRDQLVLHEQVKLLFGAIPTSIWGTPLGIFFLLLSLWSVIDHAILIIWASTLTLITAVRAIHAYCFWKASPPPTEIGKWRWLATAGSIIAAMCWGCASIWLFADDHAVQQLMLAFILSVTCAIAITNLSSLRLPIVFFIFITLLPLSLHFLSSGTDVGEVMGIMVLVLILLFQESALRVYRTTVANIKLNLDALGREEQLRKSQQRLALHIQRTPLAVIEWNTNFEVVDWNPAAEKIFGYSRSEAMGQHAFDLIEPESARKQVSGCWRELLTNNGGLHNINDNNTKDGRTILCEWYNTPLIDENGKVIGVASMTRDITERSRLEKIKNEFVSVVSHELRTPLTSIKGSLGLILGNAVKHDAEKTQELLEIANNNTHRLLSLINEILDIEKIESGQLEFNFESFDPMQMIEQAVTANAGYAIQFEVTLEITQRLKDTHVYADYERIMQVLNNLISNAIKFSPKGEKVGLSVMQQDGRVQICVTDHGPGIADDFRSKVFEKFTQQDTSNTRGVGGTGLGLSIAKGIVEHHNGTLDFKSEMGSGTTFYFDLPEKQTTTDPIDS